MLDWFSGLVGYDASNVRNGRVLRLAPDGRIESDRDAWVSAVGSYDTNLQVMADVPTDAMRGASEALGFLCSSPCLRVSGNPVKWLQGHNIWGPSVSLLGPVIQEVARKLPENVRPVDCDSDTLPSVKRTRVDVNVMVDLGSHQVVHDWLAHAALETRSRSGRALQSDTTVYWGKHSTRWSLKAYCKHCELLARPQSFPVSAGTLEYCRQLLRIELCLRRPELRDRGTLSEEIIWEFFRRIEIGVMKENVDANVSKLPFPVPAVFAHWMVGGDVRQGIARATFYKYRRMLLDAAGVDISLSPVQQLDKLEGTAFNRDLFDANVLRSRVVTRPPDSLQLPLLDV